MLDARALNELSNRIWRADLLDGAFSASDLTMATVLVLRRLDGLGLSEEYSNVAGCVARGQARPAYKRAFAAQLAVFTGKSSVG